MKNSLLPEGIDKLGTDMRMDLVIQYDLQPASGLLILESGVMMARFGGRYTHMSFAKFETEPPVRLLLVRVVKDIIFLFTLLVILQQFSIQIFPLIAGLGIAGVEIGLVLQGGFLNLFAGFSIIMTKPFRVGQFIDIFITKLLYIDRSTVIIPNRKIIAEILPAYNKICQLNLTVGVAYATALSLALAITRRIVNANSPTMRKTCSRHWDGTTCRLLH